MRFVSPYLRLMRLHQPVGIWLLLWPCWWAVALASPALPPLRVMAWFALGAVVMRGAGCIINDMADRKIDAQVERTKNRPLASGELSVRQALGLLALLLVIALGVAMALGLQVVMWGVLALVPVAVYPWMKRVSWWPQLFLGLTFNWGALAGWAAVRGQVEWPALALYAGGVLWTLGYDTIYAYQDKADDVRAGVKSTALRLEAYGKPVLEMFYVLAVLCWALAAWLAGIKSITYVFLILSLLHLMCQVKKVDLRDTLSCRKAFVSNATMGWWVLAGFILGRF